MYFRASRDAFRAKSNRIKFDCVQYCSIDSIIELATNIRCSIAEPNRTIVVRLNLVRFCSIGYTVPRELTSYVLTFSSLTPDVLMCFYNRFRVIGVNVSQEKGKLAQVSTDSK